MHLNRKGTTFIGTFNALGHHIDRRGRMQMRTRRNRHATGRTRVRNSENGDPAEVDETRWSCPLGAFKRLSDPRSVLEWQCVEKCKYDRGLLDWCTPSNSHSHSPLTITLQFLSPPSHLSLLAPLALSLPSTIYFHVLDSILSPILFAVALYPSSPGMHLFVLDNTLQCISLGSQSYGSSK